MPSRKSRIRHPACALPFAFAALLAPAAAQNPPRTIPTPPTFASGVDLITVDAVVLDRDGRPVPGLTKDDFVVTEEGRPRAIESFEAFTVGSAPEPPEPEGSPIVATNAPRGIGRAFAIVLDDLRIAPDRMPAARETAARFIERFVREGDLVTVATTGGGAWWSARIPEGREDLLEVLSQARGRRPDLPVLDRMTDYEAFWIAHREDSPSVTALAPGTGVSLPGRASAAGVPESPPPGSIKERVKQRWQQQNTCVPIYCDSLVRARAAEIDAARRAQVKQTLGCVRRALEALALVRGRKSLLFLSEGFIEDFGSDSRAVAAASREANTAVYFADVRGLVPLPEFGSAADAGRPPDERERTSVNFEEAVLESAGATALAEDTGGFSVRNTNDLSAGAWRVAAESQTYYLLGFYPPEGKAPRQWRKLKVEVKRPGLTVRARRGYTLASELAAARPAGRDGAERGPSADPAIARALDSAQVLSGIPLRAVVYFEGPRPGDVVHAVVAAEIDAAAVGAEGRPARLEVSAQVSMRDSGQVFRQDAAVTLTPAAGERPAWRALTREFDLPPGVAQLRLVARDPASGTTGSILQRLEVPFPGELRLSTPILTDRIEPAATPGGTPRPALAAHRVFAGGALYCQYEVFGAARPGGAPPRVTASFELRKEDGSTVRKAPPSPIAAGPDGRLVRTIGVSLEGLDVGGYELVVEVWDDVRGERLVRSEPFVLGGVERP